MRKFKILLILSTLAAIFYACIDDKGNYDYMTREEAMPVVISGMEDTICIVNTELKLTPTITGRTDKEDYNYLWYIYGDTGALRDTLSFDDRIDGLLLNFDLQRYNLVFAVTDRKTGATVTESIRLTITTEYSNGWFLLKDDGTQTDIDFINSSGEIRGNILLARHGDKLPGTGVCIVNQYSSYGHEWYDENGEIVNSGQLKAILVATSETLADYDPAAFDLYKDRETIFYDPEQTVRPGLIRYNRAFGKIMINDGKFYFKSASMFDPVGRYSYPYNLGFDVDLFPGAICGGYEQFLLFDLASNSYIGAAPAFGMIGKCESADNPLSLVDMNYDMLHILPREDVAYAPAGYSVMRDRDTGTSYIFDLNFSSHLSQVLKFAVEVPTASKLNNAVVLEANGTNSYIYYSTGDNILYGHLVTDMSEEDLGYSKDNLLYSFPGGETITSIQHHIKDLANWDMLNYDPCLTVTTSVNGGWKMYVFEFIGDTANINKESIKIYSGSDGAVRKVVRV